MFATDRTLLALEPMLFRDVVFLSQRLCAGTCSTSESTLTASTLDPDFLAANVQPGHILTIDGVSYEIAEVAASDTLKVSRLRASQDTPLIPPAALTDRPFTIDTFDPQLALAHSRLLQMLSLAPAGVASHLVSETALLNPADFAPFEAMLALKHLLNAAGTLSRDTPQLSALRAAIDLSLRNARQSLTANLDLNGDGLPDSRRRLDVQYLMRM